MTTKNVDEWISALEKYFAKAPALPKNAVDVLVKITPWLALIFGILGILGAVAATGFLAVLAPIAGPGGLVGAIFALVSSVLTVMAYPGLRDGKISGWKMLFYSQLVGIAGSVLALNLVGAIVSALVGFYILFQIKSAYK